MTIPKLVRIRRNKSGIIQDCDVYIGRAINQGGWHLTKSKWHNPFKVSEYGSVEKVCQLYYQYIINSDLFHDIPELQSKTLGCWCNPPKNKSKNGEYYCHGCVLIDLYKLLAKNNFDTHAVQKQLLEK